MITQLCGGGVTLLPVPKNFLGFTILLLHIIIQDNYFIQPQYIMTTQLDTLQVEENNIWNHG